VLLSGRIGAVGLAGSELQLSEEPRVDAMKVDEIPVSSKSQITSTTRTLSLQVL
jgi:hypothetical protein